MGEASPWDAARAHAEGVGVTLRTLHDLVDADRVRSVIEGVWGEQVLPREMVRAFQHAGSVLIGAEAGRDLVGFVLGFAGFEPTLHVHSHMLAVLPEWQSRGVGFALKLAQRAECLDHGVDEVRWTYDPLVARNAHLNLVKLGTEAIRYLPHFYGEMTDRLNREDRSDRFEVRWRLRSERVARAVAGSPVPPAAGAALLRSREGSAGPEPVEIAIEPMPGATVALPQDHLELRRSHPDIGQRWRETTGRCFARCFEAGLVATWITPASEYVFEPEASLA
jgi:predicted GNAT superfamily acetyltransferase